MPDLALSDSVQPAFTQPKSYILNFVQRRRAVSQRRLAGQKGKQFRTDSAALQSPIAGDVSLGDELICIHFERVVVLPLFSKREETGGNRGIGGLAYWVGRWVDG